MSSLLCTPQWHSSLHDLMCIKIRQSKLGMQQGLHSHLFDPQKLCGKVIKASADYYCAASAMWNEIQKWSICGVWAILQYIKKPEDQLSPKHRETLKLPWKTQNSDFKCILLMRGVWESGEMSVRGYQCQKAIHIYTLKTCRYFFNYYCLQKSCAYIPAPHHYHHV